MSEENNSTEKNPYETRDQFARLMLGAAAAFVATKLVENAYNSLVVERRNNPADPQQ